jgi:hypothetical protein
MRTHRLALFVPVALAALVMAGCRSNSSANTEAEVFLSYAVNPGPADVDVCGGVDVIIDSLTITSHAKSPAVTLSQQDDVILDQWVVTCTRTDGGTVASPSWQNFYTVYVPAGGSASLQNYRIFPAEYFLQAPLYQLLPQNGGYDKETGNTNIRQRVHIDLYGKTVAGKKISIPMDFNLNFGCAATAP